MNCPLFPSIELLVLALRNLRALFRAQLTPSFTLPGCISYQPPICEQQKLTGYFKQKGNLVEGCQVCQDYARGGRETSPSQLPQWEWDGLPDHPSIHPAESC